MTTLVLDAGALVALEGGDRRMVLRIKRAIREGSVPRTNAMALAQVWRGGTGRQAVLARELAFIDVRPVTADDGRAAGLLLGRSKTADAVDASVALSAEQGDLVLTSDQDDIRHLLDTAGIAAHVVAV